MVSRFSLSRPLVMVAALGTGLPLVVLALLYLLAPLPLGAGALETLRMANRFALAIVGINWIFVAGWALLTRARAVGKRGPVTAWRPLPNAR